MTEGVLVLEGRLGSGSSLAEVLEVVGISRQWMELVLSDEEPLGRILVKSGHVVAATAAPDQRGVDAFVSLVHRPTATFAVYQRPAPEQRSAPLGALPALLAHAAATPPSAPARSLVLLEGTFADVGVLEVLEVVGLSRLALELVCRDETGTRAVVLVKAGQVLEARSARTGSRGPLAIVELLRDPGTRFEVLRRELDLAGREPIGRLVELVAAANAPVLQGRFSDTRVAELLATLGLSRQVVELRTWQDERPRARVLLKAGRVLAASCDELGGRAAVRALLADPGTVFRVTRYLGAVGTPALGAIADWITDQPPADATPVRELVCSGTFAEAPLSDVLATLSLSRQHLVVMLRAGGRTKGAVVLKAGRVLDAEQGGRRGADAFRAVLRDPGESFVVYRLPPGTPLPDPLGRLQDLLEPGPSSAPAAAPTAAAAGLTEVIRPPEEDDAPTLVAPMPAPESAPEVPLALPEAAASLEARLAALATALGGLEQAIARLARRDDRILLAVLVASHLATVVLAAALLATILLGA